MTRGAALCAIALSLSMCTTGTETDNPVFGFDATECKKHETALTIAKIARSSAAQTNDPSAYDGLHCYAWDLREGGTLALDIINFSGGCYMTYKLGASRVEGSHLSLGIMNGYCEIAACGSCPYDFAFEVESIDAAQPLEVQLQQFDCHGGGDYEPSRSVVLPIDTQPSGTLCREENGVGFDEQCGRAHLPPCVDLDSPYETGACADDGCAAGLICIEDALDDYDLCFTACEEDADCTLDLESCQGGACRLRDTF